MEYTQYKRLPEAYLKEKISGFLSEDVPETDITTAGIFDPNDVITAYIQAEEEIVFAAQNVIPHFFLEKCSLFLYYRDGDIIPNKGIVARIKGPVSIILTKERVLLNLLQRLCGIATTTKRYVDVARPYHVKILDTRKTTPGLRLFDKYAVTCGGGTNHRLDLSSGILIKDNHIKAAGGIQAAIEKIRTKNYGVPIQVEVENFYELREALNSQADAVLLDNMQPDVIKQAISIVNSHPFGKQVFLEASGGITFDTLEEYAKTGVNAISVGALTHSVIAAKLHMEFE
jgi:nicotinate-nucleotide pyrophosphorylase (carboxylating)